LITYYSIFLLASTIPQKHRKIIMFVIIITGIFQIAIGTIQILRITNILGYDRSFNRSMRFKKMASGTLGNPNFYSAYILICLSYIYSKLFQKNKKIIMYIIYFLLSMLFAYGLIIGNSLGCILSFIIIFIITNIVTFIKNDYKKRRRIAITVLIFISIIISAIYNNKDLNNIISTNINEIKEIFKNGINNNTGNGRLEVWKKTIEYLPEHIYNGIGIDNFEYIENGKPITLWVEKEFQVFDKAHNEFLQKLITEGVFSFITYIILLIYVTKCYFSNNNKENYPYFVVFISYVIQSFVGISVITVAPIFYMIMGFIIYQNRDINIEN